MKDNPMTTLKTLLVAALLSTFAISALAQPPRHHPHHRIHHHHRHHRHHG